MALPVLHRENTGFCAFLGVAGFVLFALRGGNDHDRSL
jgi:hypothetical protein